jgi:hypothetical protein
MSPKTYLLISFVLSMVFSSSALGWAPIDDYNYNLSFEYNTEGEVMSCSTRVGCGEGFDNDPNYVYHCGVMAWKENEVNWPVVEMECSESAEGDECLCKGGVFATDGICDLTLGQFGSTADQNLIVWQTLDPAYDANVIIQPDHEYRISFESFLWQAPILKAYLYYGYIGDNNSVDPDVNVITELNVDVGTDYWELVTLSFKAEGGQPYIGEPLGIRFFQTLSGWYWIDDVRIEFRPLLKAYDPIPPDGGRDVPRNPALSWTAGAKVADVNGHDVYFGMSRSDVNDANTNTAGIYRGTFSDPCYLVPETLDLGQVCYWRVDEVNDPNFWKGDVWSFRVEGHARNPEPPDGAVDVPFTQVLSWTAGLDSTDHDVYFGTDFNEVYDADNDSNVFIRKQPGVTYEPSDPSLHADVTYYWRIDEYSTSPPYFLKGDIWSFTAANFFIVDDMESYGTSVNEIGETWLDGWDNYSRSTVSLQYDDPNLAYGEDSNSMAYNYMNDLYPYYSEAELVFDPTQDWVTTGMEALTLYFYGQNTNIVERMYVALTDSSNNTAEVEYDDPNDLREVKWHEWNIKLEDFAGIDGVDLTDVNSLIIGFGDKSNPQQTLPGDSDVYFDDITLYSPRCVPLYATGSFRYLDHYIPAGSFIPDCFVDYYDLAMMSRDWLISGIGNVSTVVPSDVNLIGHWPLNDNAKSSVVSDISDNYNDGVFYNEVTGGGKPVEGETEDSTITPGAVDDYALEFDGVDDYITLPVFNLNTNTLTVSAWIKRDGDLGAWGSSPTVVGCNEPNGFALSFASTATYAEQVWAANNELSYFWTGWSWDYHSDLIVPNGLWTFVALVVEPEKGTLYLYDGVELYASTNHEYHVPKAFSDMSLIGGGPASTFFRGFMDDVRIYNRSLPAGEILSLALQGSSGSQYLSLEWWRADADKSNRIDMLDFAIMADNWLKEIYWP